MKYRHELKFLVSEMDLAKLKGRLDGLLSKDFHQTGEKYTIRSLYFDDLYDSCLEEVSSGIDKRRKFRLRLYNGDPSLIRLERKSKYRTMTRKESEPVTQEICQDYMNGILPCPQGDISLELLSCMLRAGMQCKCIVEYERCAYVEEAGDVRITFDTNIRGSRNISQFLAPVCEDVTDVLPKGMHILEVKYNEFLPDYILQAIDLNNLQKTSFSKYAYVRNCTDIREV